MNNTENKKIPTPQEMAESIFAECAILASKSEEGGDTQRFDKLDDAKEAATQYLDYQVEYWLQTRAEWQNILRLTDKNKG
jgi:hypothetical protein